MEQSGKPATLGEELRDEDARLSLRVLWLQAKQRPLTFDEARNLCRLADRILTGIDGC
jgi:hypothetical protein